MSPSIPPPVIDARSYQDLVNDALARIPVHNPEWTNFNRSDPGVTLIELFAFLTESLLYRANQIPERNRRAFLGLLGVPLAPAASARGIVVLANDSGPQQTITLGADIEVSAGRVPYRTTLGLDVLPVEARAYYKQPLLTPPAKVVDFYRVLYATYVGKQVDAATLQMYETVEVTAPLEHQAQAGLDLAGTVDGSVWIALMLRRSDGVGEPQLAAARNALAGRTLNLGIVPVLDDPDAQLSPLGRSARVAGARLDYQMPRVASSGSLRPNPGARVAMYRSLDQRASVNVLDEPGIVQLTLPDAGGLTLWQDIDPLEAGVGELPPALEDAALAQRTITWLRIRASTGAQARLLWAGINAVSVTQQARVVAEVLPNGTGAPDQAMRLAQTPVLPESVVLRVGDPPAQWTPVDDLYTAGPEVPVPDLRLAPGSAQPPPSDPHVFTIEPAGGTVRFGDGLHGARPPRDAPVRADYAYGAGGAGNVGPNTIISSSVLPAGLKVTNPVRTWGGAQATTVAEGEREITRYLRHRDRLVSAEDYDAIVRRTPGVDVGRVDVVAAYNPELAPNSPGDAPGSVTLMLIPRTDLRHPEAPQPDQPFLDAICAYIDPRRVLTTEVFLRGPTYRPVWISVGFDPVAGQSIADVRDAIKASLLRFLAPLGTRTGSREESSPALLAAFAHAATGWPRRKPVVPLELLAVASRVPGVDLVQPVLVAVGDGAGSQSDPIPMNALELPVIAGISVLAGDPLPLDQVRGLAPSPATQTPFVPVPVVPESC